MVRILAALLIMSGVSAFADVPGQALVTKAGVSLAYQISALASPQISAKRKPATNALGWYKGDTLTYKMVIKPLPLVGAVKLSFSQEDKDTMTLEQDMDFKYFKVKIESVMDKETGAVKKMRINGKEQKAGKPAPVGGTSDEPASSTHVVQMEESHIKVDAGEFDCIYAVMEDGAKNLSKAWINPRDIPLSGLLKSQVVAGDLLTVVMELVSFERGQ